MSNQFCSIPSKIRLEQSIEAIDTLPCRNKLSQSRFANWNLAATPEWHGGTDCTVQLWVRQHLDRQGGDQRGMAAKYDEAAGAHHETQITPQVLAQRMPRYQRISYRGMADESAKLHHVMAAPLRQTKKQTTMLVFVVQASPLHLPDSSESMKAALFQCLRPGPAGVQKSISENSPAQRMCR